MILSNEAAFGIVITQEKAGIVSDRIIAVPAKTMLTLVSPHRITFSLFSGHRIATPALGVKGNPLH